MRSTFVSIFIFLSLMGLLFWFAHSPAANPSAVRAATDIKVVEYGNGVYYFDALGPSFGNQLSEFLRDHPDLELVSMVSDGTGVYGANRGCFVVLRPKRENQAGDGTGYGSVDNK